MRICKRSRILVASLSAFVLIILVAVFLQPSALFGTRYDEALRQIKSVTLGMNPNQVQAILGAPISVHTVTNSTIWLYADDQSTGGWAMVVEFQQADDQLALVSLLNIEHVAFTNSRRFQMGVPSSAISVIPFHY